MSITHAPIPPSIELIDPAWLTAALRKSGRFFGAAGGEVTAVSIGPPTRGIAITSRVARLRLTVRPSRCGPSSVVVKLRNPAWTDGAGMYEREVRFYNELAAAHTLPAPRCYHAELDPASGAFALLLEDLGDAEPGHPLSGLGADESEAVIDAIAGWHRTWWDSAELAARAWPRKGWSPDQAARMVATFRARWPELVARGTLPVGESLRRAVARIDDREFVDGLARLSNGPRTLIHSDLHAENLILDRTATGWRVVAIDWQNAAAGHAAIDVAMVLGAVAPAVLRARADTLLSRYRDRLGHAGERELLSDVAAAARWMLVSGISWYLDFEAESIRDRETVREHWLRLAAAIEWFDSG